MKRKLFKILPAAILAASIIPLAGCVHIEPTPQEKETIKHYTDEDDDIQKHINSVGESYDGINSKYNVSEELLNFDM